MPRSCTQEYATIALFIASHVLAYVFTWIYSISAHLVLIAVDSKHGATIFSAAETVWMVVEGGGILGRQEEREE